ncbi:hypothetical protein IP84_07045 [beta proteobacterium AAP99]|nr:hypothetical protein IP84_07045 [beta proteobacterium AAP99]
MDGSFVTQVTNALGHAESRRFDARFGQADWIQGPNGLVSQVTLDDFGRKVQELRADGTSTRTWYCYLEWPSTNALKVTERSSNTPGCPAPNTSSSFGPNSEVPPQAISFVQSQSFGANGQAAGPWVREYQDNLGRKIRTVTQAFDEGNGATNGRLIVADTYYNQNGAEVLTTQPYFLHSLASTVNGEFTYGFTYTAFDVLGRPMVVLSANDSADALSYADALARIPERQRGTFTALLADKNNWPIAHRGNQGNLRFAVIEYSYEGLKTTTTRRQPGSSNGVDENVPRELVDISWKNTQGKVTLVQSADRAQTAYVYDAQDNLVTTIDPLGNRIEVRFDQRGRRTQLWDPNKGLHTYEYNPLGELIAQQTPNQRAGNTRTSFTYDKLGRMVTRTSPEFTTTWRYDTVSGNSAAGDWCLNSATATGGNSNASSTRGLLCGVSTTHGVTRNTVYDTKLRPIENTTVAAPDGNRYGQQTFSQRVAYDNNFGRVRTQTYPTGVAVQMNYTALGFARSVTNAATGYPYWTPMTMNAWGKVEDAQLGNGVASRTRYQPLSGRVAQTGAGTGNDITAAAMQVFQHTYVWDSLNNLTARSDAHGAGPNIATGETFGYDELNRLTRYITTNNTGQVGRVNVQYNAIGNILSKSDVGLYFYPAAGQLRPHAVTSVRGTAGPNPRNYTADFEYDAQGNLIRAFGDARYRTLRYNSFNLPQGDGSTNALVGAPNAQGQAARYDWAYSDTEQRFVERRTTARGVRTTWYLHPDGAGGLSFEMEVAEDGQVFNRHYIATGSSTALLTTRSTAPTTPIKLEYWHKDHLGSTAAVSVATGANWDQLAAQIVRYSYDPWGKRRFPNGNADTANTLVGDYQHGNPDTGFGTDRGFTGHEHLDDVGIIHMNARLYDPLLGRMMQADPVVGDLFDIQTYNAYSYVYNQPLNLVDADGRCAICGAVVAGLFVARATGVIDQQTFRQGLAISASLLLGPGGPWMIAGQPFASALVAGFSSGAISSGTVKGAAQGAFSAAVFYGVGRIADGAHTAAASKAEFALTQSGANQITADAARTWGSAGIGRVALHAAAGCVTSVAGGGECGRGAATAGFGKLLSSSIGYSGNRAANTLVSALIGGTVEVIGGGKFANGAQTGAFQYLFNEAASQGFSQRSRGYLAANEHYYMIISQIASGCDTGGCANALSLRYAYSAPSYAGLPVDFVDGGTKAVWVPGPGWFVLNDGIPNARDFKFELGFIRQTVGPGGAVTNTTTAAHLARWGTVTRGVFVANNNLYSYTLGLGTHNISVPLISGWVNSELAKFNADAGARTFRALDQRWSERANRK